MAKNFNKHFTTGSITNPKRIFEFLNANISLGNVSFYLSPLNEKHIAAIINNLKPFNSSGSDIISNNLLRKCKYHIS